MDTTAADSAGGPTMPARRGSSWSMRWSAAAEYVEVPPEERLSITPSEADRLVSGEAALVELVEAEGSLREASFADLTCRSPPNQTRLQQLAPSALDVGAGEVEGSVSCEASFASDADESNLYDEESSPRGTRSPAVQPRTAAEARRAPPPPSRRSSVSPMSSSASLLGPRAPRTPGTPRTPKTPKSPEHAAPSGDAPSADWFGDVWLMPHAKWLTTMCFVRPAAAAYCLVFPFQLAFLGPTGHSRDGADTWRWIYRTLDLLLWVDMIVTFFVPIQKRGMLLPDRREVARAYLGGALPWDLLARAPWDTIIAAVLIPSLSYLCPSSSLPRVATELFTATDAGSYFHDPDESAFFEADPSFPRLARLLLLGRALGHPLGSYQSYSRLLVSRALTVMISLHWFTCALFAVSAHLAAEECSAYPDRGGNWLMQRYGDMDALSDAPLRILYIRSLQRSLWILVGESVEEVCDEEMVLSTIGLLFGLVGMAYFTGEMVRLLASIGARQANDRLKIDMVRQYMKAEGMPKDLTRRALAHLEYVFFTEHLDLRQSKTLRDLSVPLQLEVARRVHSAAVKGVLGRFVGEATWSLTPIVAMLVQRLQLRVFSPMDQVAEQGDVANGMYFVTSGKVHIYLRRGDARCFVTERGAGECLFEFALLAPGLRRPANVEAVTFCEMQFLSRAHFENVLGHFPEAKEAIDATAHELLIGEGSAKPAGAAASPPGSRRSSCEPSLTSARMSESTGSRQSTAVAIESDGIDEAVARRRSAGWGALKEARAHSFIGPRADSFRFSPAPPPTADSPAAAGWRSGWSFAVKRLTSAIEEMQEPSSTSALAGSMRHGSRRGTELVDPELASIADDAYLPSSSRWRSHVLADHLKKAQLVGKLRKSVSSPGDSAPSLAHQGGTHTARPADQQGAGFASTRRSASGCLSPLAESSRADDEPSPAEDAADEAAPDRLQHANKAMSSSDDLKSESSITAACRYTN